GDDLGNMRRGDERSNVAVDQHQAGQFGEDGGEAAAKPQTDLDASLSFFARKLLRRAISSRVPATFCTLSEAPC
ncbi:hypothetical protein WICPIJ_002315, partial [Wickerhamomyces pijperi]